MVYLPAVLVLRAERCGSSAYPSSTHQDQGWGATLAHNIASRWWGIAVLSLPLVLVGHFYELGILTVRNSFLPPRQEWVHFGTYYLFGLFLYHYREPLLALYTRRWGVYTTFSLLGFFLSMGLVPSLEDSSLQTLLVGSTYNASGWLLSMAFIGGFMALMPNQNPVFRYIADSSYWMYLVHMLGTIGFGILLYPLELAAVTKMGINIAGTTAVCLLSYELLVRHTWIGVLLNGRRSGSAPPPATAVARYD